MADIKRFVLLFLLMSSIFGEIMSKPSSIYENDEDFPSDCHGCYDPRSQELEELKSRVSSLESIINERTQELLIKEETIQTMKRTIREKSDTIAQLQSEIDFIESSRSTKRKIKGEEQNYQLEKQMNWVWLQYQIGIHLNQARAYLLTQWFDHIRPNLNIAIQKASAKMDQLRKWSEPHIKTLNDKWIPNTKDMWLTCAIYLEPKIQSLTDESIKVYHMSKKVLAPYLLQALDSSYNYIQVAKIHLQPYTNRVVIAAKPHLDKVYVAAEPYTENIQHGFTKLLNSATIYHQRAQEFLKKNELTKSVASMDLAWFVATALLGLPLIFIIKFLSAITNTKPKRNNHKHHTTNGHRRAKRRHPSYLNNQ